MTTLGERLRKARKRKGLSQSAASEAIGISNKSLSRYETDSYYPALEVLKKLGRLYDVSSEYLLGNTDSKGRDRTSEVVGGGNLRVIMHMRKYAQRYKEPSLTYVYREKRPLSEIGGIEFEEHLKECILKTILLPFKKRVQL